MTRKDYIVLAAAIKKSGDTWDAENIYQSHRTDIASEIADTLARDNSCFNRNRFYIACGVGNV